VLEISEVSQGWDHLMAPRPSVSPIFFHKFTCITVMQCMKPTFTLATTMSHQRVCYWGWSVTLHVTWHTTATQMYETWSRLH